MKIAVFHNLPSGGAKRCLHGFVKHASQKGHEIELFIPSTAYEDFLPIRPFAVRTTVIGVKRTLIGTLRSIGSLFPLHFSVGDVERAQKYLAMQINETDCDVVLVEQDRFTMSPFLLKFLTKPHVYYCQQPSRLALAVTQKLIRFEPKRWSVKDNVKPIWHRHVVKRIPEIDKANALCARYMVTNSYFSRETILNTFGMNASVSYLGVDTDVFRPAGLQRKDYVLTVGSFGTLKGYEFLVRVLANIQTRKRPPWVIIANSAESAYLSYIRRLARQSNVQFELRKMVTDEELVRHYNEAALFLYAPHLEPFGLAVLEAMACGTPVVAVKEGGIRESVKHNETGLLVDRNEEDFTQAILEVMQNDRLADRLSKGATDAVQSEWTHHHAAERLLKHLNAAMNQFAAE